MQSHDHDPHGHTHPHGHGHGHPHDHGQPHGHDHPHGQDHDHAHSHPHPTGVRGFLHELFVPHSHDAADSIDDALEASSSGVRALVVSLVVLLGTTLLQLAVVLVSGSVALLADTVHNFSDALTAIPLWVAFVLGRRPATRAFTFGFGRAEDLAGLFIIAVVALSAVVAAWQSIDRFVHPQPLHNLGWVAVAGVIGFAGNEAVAVYRIRVGRRIGSAALVADGVHARIDGFTSLAVVLGAIGVMVGLPWADPVVGLVISAAILVLLWGTVRSIGRRLMDGVEPELVDRLVHALAHTDGVVGVERPQLRWTGHRLSGAAVLTVTAATPHAADAVVALARANAVGRLRNLDELVLEHRTATPETALPHPEP